MKAIADANKKCVVELRLHSHHAKPCCKRRQELAQEINEESCEISAEIAEQSMSADEEG